MLDVVLQENSREFRIFEEVVFATLKYVCAYVLQKFSSQGEGRSLLRSNLLVRAATFKEDLLSTSSTDNV